MQVESKIFVTLKMVYYMSKLKLSNVWKFCIVSLYVNQIMLEVFALLSFCAVYGCSCYWHFGTAYWSHLQGSSSPRRVKTSFYTAAEAWNFTQIMFSHHLWPASLFILQILSTCVLWLVVNMPYIIFIY
jgi:hypothetical protein